MAHLFVAFEPLTGWRGVQVSERRRGCEFAEFVGHLAEDLYPKAEKIRLVVDNLNIHTPASFYEVFGAERARRLSRRR
jgi:phenylalanine-4-hydroxylase